MYDYVIVGTGPSGLTLAWYLSKLNKKILIVDRENSIGGCHRVRRVNNLFTEHGPRIYIDNYKNFITMLNEMGYNFDKLFTPYDFALSQIGGKSIANFSLTELSKLVASYVYFMFDASYAKITTMLEYTTKHNFSNESKDYIDRLCRLTDGAGIERYTLYEFFELINENSLYTIYQPVLPNDIGLFRYIHQKLVQTGNVTIYLNTDAIKVNESVSKIDSITISRHNQLQDIKAKKIILAIPPKAIKNLLTNIPNAFPKLMKYEKETAYLTYIPITYHWNKKLDLPKVYGFPSTEWGIAFIVLSDYMKFQNSKTVFSTCITMPNRYSSYINKTPNQCNVKE